MALINLASKPSMDWVPSKTGCRKTRSSILMYLSYHFLSTKMSHVTNFLIFPIFFTFEEGRTHHKILGHLNFQAKCPSVFFLASVPSTFWATLKDYGLKIIVITLLQKSANPPYPNKCEATNRGVHGLG